MLEEAKQTLKDLKKEAEDMNIKDESYENLMEIIEDLKSEEATLRGNISWLNEEMQRLEVRKRKDLSDEITNLKGKKSDLAKDIQELVVERSKLEKDIEGLSKSLKEDSNEFDKQIIKKVNELNELKNEINTLRVQAQTYNDEFKNKESEINKLINKNTNTENAIQEKLSAIEKATVKIEKELAGRQSELNTREAYLVQKEATLEKIKTGLEKDKRNLEYAVGENKIKEEAERDRLNRIQVDLDSQAAALEKEAKEISQGVKDLATNWAVFKKEKEAFAYKLRKSGG